MRVEVERREPDGRLLQYAVGTEVDARGERIVTWAGGEYSERVAVAEVFTADQAHVVYRQWCRDETVPAGHGLRLLDIRGRLSGDGPPERRSARSRDDSGPIADPGEPGLM